MGAFKFSCEFRQDDTLLQRSNHKVAGGDTPRTESHNPPPPTVAHNRRVVAPHQGANDEWFFISGGSVSTPSPPATLYAALGGKIANKKLTHPRQFAAVYGTQKKSGRLAPLAPKSLTGNRLNQNYFTFENDWNAEMVVTVVLPSV